MLAIAFTGGPGFGKSTTLAALEARGRHCVPESARAIIRERVMAGLPKRPPAHEFAEQILQRDLVQYRRMRPSAGPVFFDRGVVDALGSCAESGTASPSRIRQILDEYPFHSSAFVFPPWREIYTVDAERDQTFEQALAVDAAVRRWYARCGFELVEVPRVSVEERCDFILARLPAD